MVLFQLLEIVYAYFLPIDVHLKVFELLIDLLVVEQLIGQQSVLLRVFDLIDLNQLFFLLVLAYFDRDLIDFLLVFLHLNDLHKLCLLFLVITLEVEIEVAFGLFVLLRFGYDVEALLDSLDVSLFMQFEFFGIELALLLPVLEQFDIDLYFLVDLFLVLELLLGIGRQLLVALLDAGVLQRLASHESSLLDLLYLLLQLLLLL